MPNEQDHFEASRTFQAFYDETLRKVGMRAPQPVLGDTVNHYRRETLRQLKRTFLPPAHDLYQVQYRSLEPDALKALEPQLLQAVVKEANNPAHVPPGEFRKIEDLDELGRVRTIRFVGPECFVKQMGIPGRRAHIWDDHGKRYYPPLPKNR